MAEALEEAEHEDATIKHFMAVKDVVMKFDAHLNYTVWP
jgi:hypothetical protein